MVLHDRRSRYSGEEAVLHTPLKADYGYFRRRLPRLVKNTEKEKKMRRTNHLDVYLHLTDSKPGHEDAMKAKMSRIAVYGTCFSYKMVMQRQNQKPCLFETENTEFHVRVVVS